MRPSVKAKEERKWVLDTINQYFDVIVEEEDEEWDKGQKQQSIGDCHNTLRSAKPQARKRHYK